MDKPKSFVIWLRNVNFNHNAVYNHGLGHPVSFDRAARYATREEADRVNSQLINGEVMECPAPPRRSDHGIGSQWVPHRGPRPTLTQTVNLEMLHDQLRKDAVMSFEFSRTTGNPMKREEHDMAAQRFQAQANALRETLRYLNVKELPEPLDLFNEVAK